MPHFFSSFIKLALLTWFLSFGCGWSGEFESRTVYLTWQRDPTSTMTIQWLSQAESPTGMEVTYQKEGESEWHSAAYPSTYPLSRTYFLHRVELTGLDPSTVYCFKIEPTGRLFRFRTLPKEADTPVRFVVGGDMYHDTMDVLIKTSLQAAKTNPDFALLGGDIAYVYSKPKIPPKFHRWIEWVEAWHQAMVTPDGRLIPVLSAVGNHDVAGQYDQSPLQAQAFATLFPTSSSRLYYTLDFGNYLSLFILDSGHANSVGGTQKDWLKQALKERHQQLFKFAAYHVPAYPSIRPFNQRQSLAIRKHWVPLFENHGLDIAFEHHDHAYKRTYSLKNNKAHAKGVVYMGDGAWGVDAPRQARFNKRLFYLAKTASVRHFILVSLDKNKAQLSAIDEEGGLVDQFELKGAFSSFPLNSSHP